MKNKIINKIILFLLNKTTNLLYIHIEVVDFNKENYKINITRNCKKILCKKILIKTCDFIDKDETLEFEL
jgi:hypothetical protein